MAEMTEITEKFHNWLFLIAGFKVVRTLDYSHGLEGLPASDVLKFIFENCPAVIRSSGNEPKLKDYIRVTVWNWNEDENTEKIFNDLNIIIK